MIASVLAERLHSPTGSVHSRPYRTLWISCWNPPPLKWWAIFEGPYGTKICCVRSLWSPKLLWQGSLGPKAALLCMGTFISLPHKRRFSSWSAPAMKMENPLSDFSEGQYKSHLRRRYDSQAPQDNSFRPSSKKLGKVLISIRTWLQTISLGE